MNVWDHERGTWGSIRDRYSGNKDELKKVIKAIVETPYEEFDRWDDRNLREWILQYTSDQGVIDLFEFIAVLECMTEEWWDHSASDNLYVRKMHYSEKRMAAYSFWPEKGWDGLFQDLADALTENGGELRLGVNVERVVIENRQVKGVDVAAAAAHPPEREVRGRADRGRRGHLDAAGLARPQGGAGVGAPGLVRRVRSSTWRRTSSGSPGWASTWPSTSRSRSSTGSSSRPGSTRRRRACPASCSR